MKLPPPPSERDEQASGSTWVTVGEGEQPSPFASLFGRFFALHCIVPGVTDRNDEGQPIRAVAHKDGTLLKNKIQETKEPQGIKNKDGKRQKLREQHRDNHCKQQQTQGNNSYTNNNQLRSRGKAGKDIHR